MGYQSIFSNGGPAPTPTTARISGDFNPGQYSSVNAQIAASHAPTDPVKALGMQLKSGQIDMPTYITRFQKLTNTTPAAPYSIQNTASVLNDEFVQPVVNAAKTTGQKAVAQVKYLAGPTSTPQQRQSILDNQKKAATNQTLQSVMRDFNPTQISAAGKVQAQKMAASGASSADIRKFLVADAAKLDAQTRQGVNNAVVLSTLDTSGGVFGKAIGAAREAAAAGEAPLIAAGKSLIGIKRPPSALDNLVEDTAKATPEVAKSPVKPETPKVNAVVNKELVDNKLVKPEIKTVPAKSLKLGSDTLGSPIDKSTVAKYAEDIKAGKPVEPLVTSRENGQTFVQDGKHRLEAMKQAGVTDIPTVERVTKEATKTSGSALKSEQRAVQAGLTKEFEGKAGYAEGSYKTEAEKAVKLAAEKPQDALDIALGKKPGDNTIHEVAVRRAVERQALKNGDIETLRQIANSPSHTATSEAAQRLGAEGYNADPSSPVEVMRKVASDRQAVISKRLKASPEELISKTTKEIKAAVPKVSHQNWSDFVESIKC